MASVRKIKEDRPVLAICYDFDKTLSPDDMQAQGYIQSVYDGDIPSFWKETNSMAEANEMDANLAYMYKMVRQARGRIVLTRKSLQEYGSAVKLFPGVEDWFERIRKYGAQQGVIVEHYIISSGLKEMIEGTSAARAGAFEKIYASSFMFDEDGVPIWPAQVVNYTNKTQFLFRIEKGVLDVNDSGVNDYFAPEDIRVPFRNMIYIGDSDTDIPCMKLVNVNGGHSIGVYNNDTLDKTKVYRMLRDGRIRYFAPADYRDGSRLDGLVKAIISRTAANEVLEEYHYECKDERERSDRGRAGDAEKRRRLDLILSLNGSAGFATTLDLVRRLAEVREWEQGEADMLLKIALKNPYVKFAFNRPEVKDFYSSLLQQLPQETLDSVMVKKLFEA